MVFKSKRNLAAVSLAALLFIIPGTPVQAAPDMDVTTVAGLCGHHTEHTADCLAGTLCSHLHTEDCYNFSAGCLHVHTQACRRNCTHICTETSGCITSELACCHEHNEDCIYAEGSTCNYSCDSCHAANQSGSQGTGYCAPSRRSSHHGSHHSGRRHHC